MGCRFRGASAPVGRRSNTATSRRRFPRIADGHRRPAARGVLRSADAVLDPGERTGHLPDSADRCAGSRNAPEPAVCRHQHPLHRVAEPRGELARLQRPGRSLNSGARCPGMRRRTFVNLVEPGSTVRRADQSGRLPRGQDLALRADANQRRARRVQRLQREPRGDVQPELLPSAAGLGASWLQPAAIIGARIAKLSVQFDF